jgi:hypothetical protein
MELTFRPQSGEVAIDIARAKACFLEPPPQDSAT